MGKRGQAYTAPSGRVQHLHLQDKSTEQALHIPSLLLNSPTLQRPSRQQPSVVICDTASRLLVTMQASKHLRITFLLEVP